ncbi:bifunctional SulP family inorganic anion transporter/carbonic anhydrase [Acinetobacter courvalinii]|uniref:bifunctional SulP family inorganic anion transporter/carbonic anhydrase n=1 Tax=Acinetobacter courvalinii TaxID=280147 RepID=UPI0004467B8F|nr:SulP family inorganic anion transporter [Acinetobacter courvalinii]EXB26738.1 sulfate transporter family protein [Acinetobacter baumannii 1437282]MCU4368328.1 bifunctional SulP family inorganic anion transporter/carbonic anhydrase [Acinetobacter courvalinii]MCU4446698.1 bifunctional SulP family inorganic anion transporter/carbonic anhydrase [Acinetobacter courvalinii]MCU4640098.1 bifunctional SulP family inorganic anion transporter/carbonic anhydrase [Acinetobacter courvalinii]
MTSLALKNRFHLNDLLSGVVVFLVALPLCLGIALASGAPIISGIIAGIVGGIIVGLLSGSHISVSGPAAGLTAVILVQLDQLGGNYAAFLLCIVFAGILQILFGLFKLGFFANFIPNNVILGLLAAIGAILIVTQLPYLFGLSSFSWDMLWTSTPSALVQHFDLGAALIGLLSLFLILAWDSSPLKKLALPSALIAVVLAAGLNFILISIGSPWAVQTDNLIQLPNILEAPQEVLVFPDFAYLAEPLIYTGAVTLAIVASLETLLNLEAADKLDSQKRSSPPNRELWAQGAGNIVSGLIGGMPVTSVIVRSSVNANTGARSKCSTIFHGILLLLAILFFVPLMNMIPLSALAAILIVTGFKLTHPKLFKQLYQKGWKQFLPFIITLVAILLTDLLTGIVIGLLTSSGFILYGNFNKGVRVYKEKHLHGIVTRIELPSQVTFLNRSALISALEHVHKHQQLIIDATQCDSIDPDIYQVIQDYQNETASKRQIDLKLIGFKQHYQDVDEAALDIYISTRELQRKLSPQQVITLLKEGNERFVKNERLQRDVYRQIRVTADEGQHPIAAVLGCMDSRAPTEMIFDVGIGDLFSLRIAGNIAGQKVLGSLEFACQAKGSKVILVLGHTDCGAVTSACQLRLQQKRVSDVQEMPHIQYVLGPLMHSVDSVYDIMQPRDLSRAFINQVTAMNVHYNIQYITAHSPVLKDLLDRGEIAIVGAIYDVKTGQVEFLDR